MTETRSCEELPLRGLTWDHPRGYAVPEALAALDAAGDETYGRVPTPLAWSRQPLQGFESRPLNELADDYDVLVVDHPGLGDAIRAGALLPMDALFPPGELAAWRASTVGSCYDSYHVEGRQWALPLDAAAQVCVVRPDQLGDEPPPSTWGDVRALASRRRITLCLAGPHALVTLLSMCRAAGADRLAAGPDQLIDPRLATTVVQWLAELFAMADRELSLRDPIGVLDAMSERADIACCPLVFGYVTYSSDKPGRSRLRAIDVPRWRPNGGLGSVLGGTGLAVSARVRDRDGVRAHLRRLMSTEVQTRLAPRVGGQPSAHAAWISSRANETADGFYRATLATVWSAWIRPRRAGWIGFQDAASAALRDGLLAGAPPHQIAAELNMLYRTWPWPATSEKYSGWVS